MKKSSIIIGVIVVLFLLGFIVLEYNDINSLEYIKRHDPGFVDQEIMYSLPDRNTDIHIYRNADGINVALLEWRHFLGWKMTRLDNLYFEQGPAWDYLEIDSRNHSTIAIAYGFFYDDPQNYRNLTFKSTSDYFVWNPHSNLSFGTDIRAWYVFIEGRLLQPEAFVLIDADTQEVIY